MTGGDRGVYTAKNGLVAVIAWCLVIVFGFILFLFSLYMASILAGSSVGEGLGGFLLIAYMFASSGIVVLLPLIMLSSFFLRRRVSIFFAHIKTALSAGAVIYMIAMLFVVIATYSAMMQDSSDTGGVGIRCTTLDDQYREAVFAMVPVGTDVGSGSAFAVGDTSTLLTAYHVVEGASEVYASWTTGKVGIEIIDVAPEFDLALLKIDEPVQGYLNLSSDYEVTDELYTYGWPGNAFTAGQASVSKGVVSRVLSADDLRLNGSDAPNDLEIIQTDAAVNPGNFGGPLMNNCGVIGIAQSVSDSSELHRYIGVASEQGISFSISAKTAAKRFNLPISE